MQPHQSWVEGYLNTLRSNQVQFLTRISSLLTVPVSMFYVFYVYVNIYKCVV